MNSQDLIQSEVTIEECIDAYKQNNVGFDMDNIRVTCTVCDERINNFILSDYAENNEIMCKTHCTQKLKDLFLGIENKSMIKKIELIRTIYNIVLTNMHVWINFNHLHFLGITICKAFEFGNSGEQCTELENLRNYLTRWVAIVVKVLPRELILTGVRKCINDPKFSCCRKQVMNYFGIV